MEAFPQSFAEIAFDPPEPSAGYGNSDGRFKGGCVGEAPFQGRIHHFAFLVVGRSGHKMLLGVPVGLQLPLALAARRRCYRGVGWPPCILRSDVSL